MNKNNYVYLVQPQYLLGTNRYKIGGSAVADKKRLEAYHKNRIEIYLIKLDEDYHKLETIIKTEFKKKFTLIAGTEYFEGDIEEMKVLFREIYNKYNNKDNNIALYEKIQEIIQIKNEKLIILKQASEIADYYLEKNNLGDNIIEKIKFENITEINIFEQELKSLNMKKKMLLLRIEHEQEIFEMQQRKDKIREFNLTQERKKQNALRSLDRSNKDPRRKKIHREVLEQYYRTIDI